MTGRIELPVVFPIISMASTDYTKALYNFYATSPSTSFVDAVKCCGRPAAAEVEINSHRHATTSGRIPTRYPKTREEVFIALVGIDTINDHCV